MGKVVGIGGIFFKAKDPVALKAWYEQHLGIPSSDWGHVFEGEGQTVWSPFEEDSEKFSQTSKEFMVNYRVDNLAEVLEQLRATGAPVEESEDQDYGLFAWSTDPEGNRFELWQP